MVLKELIFDSFYCEEGCEMVLKELYLTVSNLGRMWWS